MKRLFMSLLAIFFPWVVLFLNDNPGGALIALILQATVVGWIPASMWAWRIVHAPNAATAPDSDAKPMKNE
ncbi:MULTISPECIES: YqaE/Pmp3 family membrane protein [Legionella]|uniref:YqaE/Pmp3 family membrane protein n=1 Tax=Legionella septentrionalis TaxID=2498109 RepID=A0A433JHB2_9GAMM|nr:MULTISPECIES: YqaE/Pmp3 family membrane protein [Legionella]MCP0914719.1 YqaE/Pmp3 family membrane protein [Legionella sp. 27cVA30]RUQ81727.1 YqaE/Pmp3 family membrane protein [Legionella septentrionalis]RUR02792.1 YqaE/Pmp3 family membrane protein [Legionella septentrionalis]RUR11390.1 YqaE/Pmp3 family membrane protein [Legionella septentrionalis]RUR15135.1 YqaE/Pmp3 family membrane protein [Legionella septentrionalis]